MLKNRQYFRAFRPLALYAALLVSLSGTYASEAQEGSPYPSPIPQDTWSMQPPVASPSPTPAFGSPAPSPTMQPGTDPTSSPQPTYFATPGATPEPSPTPLPSPAVTASPSPTPSGSPPAIAGSATFLDQQPDFVPLPPDVHQDAQEALADELVYQSKHRNMAIEKCGASEAAAGFAWAPPGGVAYGVPLFDTSIKAPEVEEGIWQYRMDMMGIDRVDIAPTLDDDPYRFGPHYFLCHTSDYLVFLTNRSGRFLLRIHRAGEQAIVAVDAGINPVGRQEECHNLDLVQQHGNDQEFFRQVNRVNIPWLAWDTVHYYAEHSGLDARRRTTTIDDMVRGLRSAHIPEARIHRHNSTEELRTSLQAAPDAVIAGHGLRSQVSTGNRSESHYDHTMDGWNNDASAVSRALHAQGTRNVLFWSCCVSQGLKAADDEFDTDHLMYLFARNLAAPGQPSRVWGYDEPIYINGNGVFFTSLTTRLRGIQYTISEDPVGRVFCCGTGNWFCNGYGYNEQRDVRDMGTPCYFGMSFPSLHCNGTWSWFRC